MVISDLKVEYASVNVSNAKAEDSKYKISASFNTRDGNVTSINGGNVTEIESGVPVCDFNVNYDYQNSVSYSYKGQIDKQTKCEIMFLIDDFIVLATAKAIEEAAE